MKSEIESELEQLVKESTQPYARNEWLMVQKESKSPLFDYRYDHVRQVVDIAKKLAKRERADLQIVTLAAWLHDIAKPGVGGVPKHGDTSAKLAADILKTKGFDESIIVNVVDVIRKHVGLTLDEPLVPLEAQILWEADKIAKLGLVGFVHHIINGIRLEPGMLIEDIDKAVQEFMPFAEKIVSSMYTQTARVMAEGRLEHLKITSKFLDKEISS
ncbi:MAG: HD domain-containing protein [Candidatus Thorarchaeota archaeon]|jgi:uncharacterized protein